MNFKATSIPYAQTHFFSNIVLDYLNECETLKPFYNHFPKTGSLKLTIEERSKQKLNRALLANSLLSQYEHLDKTDAVISNIELLKKSETFTITTAHQPNIFTGPLYFIYKIVHAIKLAAYCKEQFPQYNFVPVYYMGSEDADLDELGHVFLTGEKLTWQTSQTGAVGRMKVDDGLLNLIKRIESEIGVLPHAEEITAAVKKYYTKGTNIQDATLGFVNHLFARFGLVVLVPDNAALKSEAMDLFKEELLHQRSSAIVEKTAQNLAEAGYKAQAHGRDINLFYLKDDGQRLRMEKKENKWHVLETDISFNKDALMLEVESHPERFSPNVILRGVFQEMILPNIAFIGGGGELAYWLELKEIFNHYKVSYPILILRNSFLVLNKKQGEKATKLGFSIKDLFKSRLHLKSKWVTDHSANDVSVANALKSFQTIFDDLSKQATPIDVTLKGHIYALQKQHEKKIAELGKKFLRAEKRNHSDAMRQIDTLKQQLFPFDNLQERMDNIIPYLAIWGPRFMDALYQNSKILNQEFIILEET